MHGNSELDWLQPFLCKVQKLRSLQIRRHLNSRVLLIFAAFKGHVGPSAGT